MIGRIFLYGHVFPPRYVRSDDGPQARSRTSPAGVVRRCGQRQSAETSESTTAAVEDRGEQIIRLSPARSLGDIRSRSLSVMIFTCDSPMSVGPRNFLAVWRVNYASVLPSGSTRRPH